MKKLLVMFAMAVTLVACNNSSDGTTANDTTNTTNDTPAVVPGGASIDTSHSSTGDTATNTADTTKRN